MTARLQVLPPEGTEFDSVDGPATLSPDGRSMAFVASDRNGVDSLYLRPLDSVEARKVEGTDGSYDPFWSPDSHFLGFGAEAGLVKVDISGGPTQKITEMPDGRGCTWNQDNIILFAKNGASPLFRVPAAGGPPQPVTTLDESRHETGHWRPHFLPDGTHFLFLVKSSEPANDGIYIGSLDSKERTRLADIDVPVMPAPPGYLFYVRDRILMAHPFDLRSYRLAGDPFPVARNVQYVPTWGAAGFSVSDTGILTHQGPSRRNRQLVWFDLAGKQIGTLGEPAEYNGDPRLSPDGRFSAIARLDPETRGSDLWVLDVSRGIASRLTSDPSLDRNPVWSPDGKRLAFMSNRLGIGDLYVKPANGSGNDELLFKSDGWSRPLDWSPDGESLLFDQADSKTSNDLWILALSGDKKPRPLLDSPFSETEGRFSPDGRWIAYVSNETGRSEVFVQPYPPSGPKWQVSTSGGTSPRWRRDGKEILYFQPEASRMAVEVKTEHGFESGIPKKLFDTPLGRGSDVTGDGQRLLINLPQGEAANFPVTVVLNWTADLKR
jgi:Tol biopolymer transport system component